MHISYSLKYVFVGTQRHKILEPNLTFDDNMFVIDLNLPGLEGDGVLLVPVAPGLCLVVLLKVVDPLLLVEDLLGGVSQAAGLVPQGVLKLCYLGVEEE